MSRTPSPPPTLPGFTYLQPLGAGGFADVFLYEQEMPRRKVAVKVLLADRITTGAAQEFTDEANVMAMLSTHPAIVTIYQAGVAGDGRPYLVMEYCPRPNLQARARREPFSVAEALRVGIQVAGAVETAHRAGVLHRDIKPANILVTEYNRPALTDFGIASTTGAVTEAAGMSIPWSPPESFAEPPRSGPRTDVYALGATIYTLLVGRSPFERPGERNTSADLIERIERMALPPLARADSPASLQATLARAMAKNADDRYPSAVAFARALQKVQIELSHSVTPIDIVDEHPSADELRDDDDGLTRVREVQSISPDSPTATRPSAATEPRLPAAPLTGIPRFEMPQAPSAHEHTQRRPADPAPVVVDDEPTLLRPPTVLAPTAPQPQQPAPAESPLASPAVDEPAAGTKRRVSPWVWIGAAAAVVAIGVAIGLGGDLTRSLLPSAAPTAEDDEPAPQDVVSGIVPPVDDLAGTRAGDAVTFTWTNPDPQDGDSYIWAQVTLDGVLQAQTTESTTVTLEGVQPGRTCIEVTLVRADRRSAQEVRECVE
ncbi:serine/threonine protein kinase [Microbacterium esteraromaticum]|uniref:non-specific serine/threonine protein kinase n=1 Tax=Microbacterium esteraromaticum TaxID=57043 RepID=A0A7D7WDN7_9MICO|nr:serine/threonine-protein kinase [Microbacterium esteraromaticum]QMU97079.1 serine/threonine protein kinase [Microbacterium esteraromaticum]